MTKEYRDRLDQDMAKVFSMIFYYSKVGSKEANSNAGISAMRSKELILSGTL